ncbi:hypothetical protein ON010_g309 [Phytophthora cinnamomi]|nr:hypothetical protein ON010_g309 [Phytophthora cinnamomi]
MTALWLAIGVFEARRKHRFVVIAAVPFGERFELLAGILVPEAERAISARCGEGSERVERNVAHRVNVRSVAVALKCKVIPEKQCKAPLVRPSTFRHEKSRLYEPLVLVFNVLNCAASLDRADREARCVREARNGARLELEVRLDGLVDLRGFADVEHVHLAVGCGHHQQRVFDVHGVAALRELHGRHGRGRPGVPVLERLVPAARGHAVGLLNSRNAADRRVVLRQATAPQRQHLS